MKKIFKQSLAFVALFAFTCLFSLSSLEEELSLLNEIDKEICCLCEQRRLSCRKLKLAFREAQRVFNFDKMEYRRQMKRAQRLKCEVDCIEQKIYELDEQREQLELEP